MLWELATVIPICSNWHLLAHTLTEYIHAQIQCTHTYIKKLYLTEGGQWGPGLKAIFRGEACTGECPPVPTVSEVAVEVDVSIMSVIRVLSYPAFLLRLYTIGWARDQERSCAVLLKWNVTALEVYHYSQFLSKDNIRLSSDLHRKQCKQIQEIKNYKWHHSKPIYVFMASTILILSKMFPIIP